MTLYERIEKLRNKKGISQGNLEKELGFSNGSISKWKKSTPNPQRLEKLASYFGVTSKFLLGEENEIECKECGQIYNPFNEFDCAIHERFHDKIIYLQNTFSFIVPYKETARIKFDCLEKMQLCDENFYKELTEYLKADFSDYLYANYEPKKSYDFDDFCKTKVIEMINSGKIPDKEIDLVLNIYKIDRNFVDTDGALLARISNNRQLMRLLSYAEKLSPTLLDALEAQAEAWANKNFKNNGV